MNRALIQCVVDSLRVSGPPEESLSRLRTFRESDWRNVLPWLDESGLALYFLNLLTDTGSLNVLPAEVRVRFDQNLTANRIRLDAMKDEFGVLLKEFAAAGVKYAVLKGFALIPEYCPDAALRNQGDYDFLVHPQSIFAAREALEAQGYSLKVTNPKYQTKEGELIFTAQPLGIPSTKLNFYSLQIPRTVELHSLLWELRHDLPGVEAPEDPLTHFRVSNWGGLSFPVLTDDDALIFQMLHAFQHIVACWCRPSCFLEIAHFMARRESDAAFWERCRRRAGGYRYLPQIMGLVLSMAEKLFHAPIRAEVAGWTTRTLPAALSLWVQRHGREWALARFPGSKVSLFVHEIFLGDPIIWKSIERYRLFPFHRPPRVVQPTEENNASRWRANWAQGRFLWGRIKFHLCTLLTYAWKRMIWKRTLARIGAGEL